MQEIDVAAKTKLKAFDEDFLNEESNESIKELLLVVNYLHIEDMFDFLAQAITNSIKNRGVNYVHKFFRIENDFTPEEEAKVREEKPWAHKSGAYDKESNQVWEVAHKSRLRTCFSN